MITRIPLERIWDNPFQTRTVYNGIEELAESIRKMKAARPETSGLMQVATGRIVAPTGKVTGPGWTVLDPEEYGGVESALGDEPNAVVQIAFAHRRLRAFHILAESDPDYATYPVEVIKLTNDQMADLAWEENAKRKDLTAIEEAEALELAMGAFDYTQAQIGQRWGLSQSAVANKLRLLKLPEEAKQAIRSGQLSEKAGRALLTAAGKSERIYEAAAAHILPPKPVAEEVAQSAAEMVRDRDWYQRNRVDADVWCNACHEVIRTGEPALLERVSFGVDASDQLKLCWNCYRQGNGWETPSGSEAAARVENVFRMSLVYLDRFNFPLDEAVGQGLPKVVCGTCTECSLYEAEEGTCLDKICATEKQRVWYEALKDELRTRMVKDYGIEEITITEGYDGHRLRSDGCDAEMVKPGGPCSPGNCKRVQFKFLTYDDSIGIKPYDDLPFYFYCDHTGAHKAAQRRYLEGQKSEEEKSEAAVQAEMVQARKAEARRIYKNALASIQVGLREGNVGAWNAVAEMMLLEVSDSVEAIWQQMAAKVLQTSENYLSQKSLDDFWRINEDAVETFKDRIDRHLDAWQIPRLPDVDSVQVKLEKMWVFLYNGRLDMTLKPEQVKGNIANLEKVLSEALGLVKSGVIERGSERFEQIRVQARECRDEIEEAAGDIEMSLETGWDLQLEILLNQLDQGDSDER